MQSENGSPKRGGATAPMSRRSTAAAWIAFGLILAVLVGFACLIAYRAHVHVPPADLSSELQQEHPLFPPGVSLKPVDKPVIGNLGGMPVTFPAEFAENVQYDGDPGIGEKRKGAPPERTHQSALTSLGFKVRYPDFAVMSYKSREEDRSKYSIFNTPWIRVRVTAGSIFGDGNFLERSAFEINSNPNPKYKKLEAPEFGLQVYRPLGFIESLRDHDPQKGYRNSMNDEDIYVHYGGDGRVDAFIRCNNVNHDAAPCEHTFYLDPSLRVKLTVGYRRGMLPNWQKIQESIGLLIFGLRAKSS